MLFEQQGTFHGRYGLSDVVLFNNELWHIFVRLSFAWGFAFHDLIARGAPQTGSFIERKQMQFEKK